MEITLAKALKRKNRLIGKIRKTEADIQAFNSRPAEKTEVEVDVSKLDQERQDSVNKLVELKTKIIVANGPIWDQILTLVEIKNEIRFWAGVPTTHGKNFVRGYRDTEVLEYEAQYKKKYVDQRISILESRVDSIQDVLDQHNYKTMIEFDE